MGRPNHVFESGFAQHLTWTTHGREPWFRDCRVAEMCLSAIDAEREFLGLDVFGYVLMPDHVHLVVLSDFDSPGRIVQGMKISSASTMRAAGISPRSPWAPGYWDRAIRSTTDLRSVLNYLHANPVRAGLTGEMGAYKFSSYGHYHESGKSLLQLAPFP